MCVWVCVCVSVCVWTLCWYVRSNVSAQATSVVSLRGTHLWYRHSQSSLEMYLSQSHCHFHTMFYMFKSLVPTFHSMMLACASNPAHLLHDTYWTIETSLYYVQVIAHKKVSNELRDLLECNNQLRLGDNLSVWNMNFWWGVYWVLETSLRSQDHVSVTQGLSSVQHVWFVY